MAFYTVYVIFIYFIFFFVKSSSESLTFVSNVIQLFHNPLGLRFIRALELLDQPLEEPLKADRCAANPLSWRMLVGVQCGQGAESYVIANWVQAHGTTLTRSSPT